MVLKPSPEERIVAIETAREIQWKDHIARHDRMEKHIGDKFDAIDQRLEKGSEIITGLRVECGRLVEEVKKNNGHCHQDGPVCNEDGKVKILMKPKTLVIMLFLIVVGCAGGETALDALIKILT